MPILSGPARGWLWEHDRNHLGFTTGGYEKHVQRAIKRWLPKDGWFMDVGAHRGFHSMVALACGAEHVTMIEPNPENVEAVARWTRTNNVAHGWQEDGPVTSMHNIAVSNREGYQEFYHWTSGDSMHGRLDAEKPAWLWGSSTSYKVRVNTVDSIGAGDGIDYLYHPDAGSGWRGLYDVVKVDVEGHECQVLMGAEQTLRVSKPVVIWTVHGGTFARCRTMLEEFLGVNVRWQINSDTYLSVPMKHFGGSYANRPDGIRGPVPAVRV